MNLTKKKKKKYQYAKGISPLNGAQSFEHQQQPCLEQRKKYQRDFTILLTSESVTLLKTCLPEPVERLSTWRKNPYQMSNKARLMAISSFQ